MLWLVAYIGTIFAANAALSTFGVLPIGGLPIPAVRLFVGGHAGRVQGESQDLTGDRCFTAAHRPQVCRMDTGRVIGLLDSGAFTDPPARRLSPAAALDRQLAWEGKAAEKWGGPWRAAAFVSYDLLIDETWVAGERHKRRWDVGEAEYAVSVTIDAARYLAGQRARVAPRRLVLSCQGVDPAQYDECATEVLRVARPGDWLGLGGWCILGRQKTLLPSFWQTLRLVLPRASRAGLDHVHIFGVLWPVALGGLVWLADRHGLAVSTDSTAPILSCTWQDRKKSGARMPYWRDNVEWWRSTLADLRASAWYREPAGGAPARQLGLW